MKGNVGENSQFPLIFPRPIFPLLPKKDVLPLLALFNTCSPPLTDGKMGTLSTHRYSQKVRELTCLKKPPECSSAG